MNFSNGARSGYREKASLLEGLVELWAYHGNQLIDYQKLYNIILFQGNAEIIRTISSNAPTTPRIITRMAVGDLGTIPSDSTVPKVPVKTASGLFHEFYRKDIDTKNLTLYSPVGFTRTGNTSVGSDVITSMSSSAGIVQGMVVTGTGIPAGTVVVQVLTLSSIKISATAVSTNTGITLNFSGIVNECQFITTFNATDVPATSYANPSQPRINEVGLVIINPTAVDGIVRTGISAPTAPPADEVLLSIRTFKSVPFEVANDASVVIRYTIFTE